MWHDPCFGISILSRYSAHTVLLFSRSSTSGKTTPSKREWDGGYASLLIDLQSGPVRTASSHGESS